MLWTAARAAAKMGSMREDFDTEPCDLDFVQEILARQEVERLAAEIDWKRAPKKLWPPQLWFDAEDNPFEPEEPAS
jgi:hypothetical protein